MPNQVDAASGPEAPDAEGFQLGVGADDGDVFGEGVGGDDAIEGVAVCAGEAAGTQGDVRGDGDEDIAGVGDESDEVFLKREGTGKLAETHFGGDFQGTGSRDQKLMFFVAENCPRDGGESLGLCPGPRSERFYLIELN